MSEIDDKDDHKALSNQGNHPLLNEPTPEVTSTPNLPERPPQMPFLPTTENIPRLKDYLLKVFLTTAFNNDKSKPFPKMTGVPKAHRRNRPQAATWNS